MFGPAIKVHVPGDALGGFVDSQEAIARARRLARRIASHGMSDGEWAEISSHASDPDFAPAFIKAARSSVIASGLASAWTSAQRRGSGYAPGDPSGLITWGRLLATAGRHGQVFDKAWFVSLYQNSPAADLQSPLQYVAETLGHANFSEESLVQIADVAGLSGPELLQFDHESPADRMASQKLVLNALRKAHVPPARYRSLLKEYWAAKATMAAGIDGDGWDPANGVKGNRQTINQVYEYYGRLFLAHPELRWAGMANLVGPGFAAGFMDLSSIRAIAQKVRSVIDRANPLPPGAQIVLGTAVPGLGGAELDAKFLEIVAHMTDDDLKFYETTFLTMQRDILQHMGGLQEAYLADPNGLRALKELEAAGIIKPAIMQAFSDIRSGRDSGRGETVPLLDRAAQALARREQFDVIGANWDKMRDHPVDGEAMTYFMTLVGQPSIPGAHSPGEVSPIEVSQGISVPSLHERWVSPGIGLPPVPVSVSIGSDHREIILHTPLPDFIVSDRNSRWRFFLRDTLPAALMVLDGPRDRVDTIVASSLDDRIAQQRITARLPAIPEQLGPSHWDVKVEH